MTTVHTTLDSPLGELVLTGRRDASAPGGLVLATLAVRGGRGGTDRPAGDRDDAAFAAVAEQLDAYFAGTLTRFDLACAESGSPFERRVWEVLDTIPYGTTTTYGAVTGRIGEPPGAARRVGAAIGANPLLVVRPCHRVIGADGSLTGYAAGPERKQRLLALEGATLPL
ncbi:methylated-DNA--[protein]-cysteine S-methyltransferase [Streptomyces sp. LP05-1]|uniref:Methylated-DNA--[protein]-cysteine S-methyltransferase n=1 Tax=Streptomyces pyxinae TaxID=2970734 RepID=A0ABT2CK57_9ACTN|nr:methylated-DNA--[protein]-cysteine S-methyltransferase [Streptomyces sp. LP05-1]MCS0637805.1 methylated-DNA--[protein]-cysteine S-methyltransferase [Streptomyces sp. LP05-1]